MVARRLIVPWILHKMSLPPHFHILLLSFYVVFKLSNFFPHLFLERLYAAIYGSAQGAMDLRLRRCSFSSYKGGGLCLLFCYHCQSLGNSSKPYWWLWLLLRCGKRVQVGSPWKGKQKARNLQVTPPLSIPCFSIERSNQQPLHFYIQREKLSSR